MLPTRPIVGFHDVEGRISDAPKIRPCFFATSSVASVRLTLAGCVPAVPASVWPESFRVVSGFLVGGDEGLLRFFTGVVPPVGLHEHGVDLLEIDGLGLVAHGFDHGSDAQVAHGSQDAFGEADDEVQGVFGDGAVRQATAVELVVDVRDEGVGGQWQEVAGVADAAFEVAVGTELEGINRKCRGGGRREPPIRSAHSLQSGK